MEPITGIEHGTPGLILQKAIASLLTTDNITYIILCVGLLIFVSTLDVF